MGIYIKGAFGAFSGKVGNLVGSNWRSITYMRSLPKRSSKPATEKQLAHRAKFALAVKFLSPLRDLINLGYNDKSRSTMTAFNKATDELMANIEGVYPDYQVPFDKVQFSTGPVRPLTLGIENDGGMLTLTWQNRPALGASADDQIVLVFYNEESEDFYIIQESTRGEEQYILPTNTLPQGEYHFWILLTNEKGQCSKTRYEGTVMV